MSTQPTTDHNNATPARRQGEPARAAAPRNATPFDMRKIGLTPQELSSRLAEWQRLVSSFQLQKDANPARAWIRLRAMTMVIRASNRLELARDLRSGLETLHDAAEALKAQLETKIDPSEIPELEAWLHLQHERSLLERGVQKAKALLRRTYQERSHRHVREWFAHDLPVPVLAAEPVPSVDSEEQAQAELTNALRALAKAEAACVARPSKQAQQALAAYAARERATAALSDDPAVIDREADEGRRRLSNLPSAGREPTYTGVEELLIVPRVLRPLWWAALFAGLIAGLIVIVAIVMGGRVGDELHLFAVIALVAWVAVAMGWGGHRLADLVLKRRHAGWTARSTPRHTSYCAIAWQYVVRRAVVEQYEAEASALRKFLEAAANLQKFDSDPEGGSVLAAVRARRADLAGQIDLAAADLQGDATERDSAS